MKLFRGMILLGLLWILGYFFPFSVSAWEPADWHRVGSDHHLWSFEGDQITGYAQWPNTASFFLQQTDEYFESWRFQVRITPLQGVDHNLVWNFLDENNYYQAHFAGGAVWVSRFINGQEMLAKGENFSMVNGQDYPVVIEQRQEKFRLLINNQPIVVFTDQTYDQQSRGRVGFKLAPGATTPVETRFGNIQLTELAGEELDHYLLSVEPLKQIEPAWQDVPYDSAQQWSSQPTIGRWGCLLTSLTMIMRYYQLDVLPDALPVDPISLNQWLMNQPDGYLGQGLLNWWAATRLFREISEMYSTPQRILPKLEFQYQQADWQSRLRSEIFAQQPVIAQVPGHFVVVKGVDQQQDRFLINDPFYDFTRLDQHDEVESLRLLTPSQTDLSALVVVHSPVVEAVIKNQDGGVVSQTWQEQLAAPLIGQMTEAIKLTVVHQPADGEYQVEIEGVTEDAQLKIYAYDQRAEPTVFVPEKQITSQNILVDFQKNGTSEFSSLFSWGNFLQQLAVAHDNQQLATPLFEQMKILATHAQQTNREVWGRYKNYLQNIIELQQAAIESSTQEHLLFLLQ